jgi:hypothetical protein
MIFDPLTKILYTENGELIKRLFCPYKIYWTNLETSNSKARSCSECDRQIIDTDELTDNELLGIIRQNPDTCIKIDLNQENIQIINNGFLEQK